jgi:glucuronoarabinoxylan endo-1,4-beta-xylanase
MCHRYQKLIRIITAIALLFGISISIGQSQITNIVDQFNPSGVNGFSYSGGQINSVWANWFGSAFQSAVWDSTMDANSNVNSGSMKITASFSGGASQFEVYDGFSGIRPPVNGTLITNFQCDVRFDPSSATGGFNGGLYYGFLQFGVATDNNGQDYFPTAVNVMAGSNNWVHVSIPISAASDLNLSQIGNVLIHIYGPNYSPALSGTTTFWVDNIAFTGPSTIDQSAVDWNTTYQRIDGFGGSSAWSSLSTMNAAVAKVYFSTNNNFLYTNTVGVVSTNNGAGFSLLRSHIYYANDTLATSVPSTSEAAFMQLAQGYGARVWSTPWTPAAGFKQTNDIYDGRHATAGGLDGGSYLGSGNNITNLNYASQLANYVASMKNTYGINLYALSIQNEPDANVTNYEACQWSDVQFHDFVTNLNIALIAQSKKGGAIPVPKIIAPETENWKTNLVVNVMSDPVTATNVGIIACHDYNATPPFGTPLPISTYANPNAAVWETETAVLSGNDDTSVTNAVYWATRIHLFMTVAQANAWHFWWMVPGTSQNLLDNNSTPLKRLYAIGQFSRFVRPDYNRIAANNGGPVLVSAYKDTNSLNYAIVAINPAGTNIVQTFNLNNFPASSTVTPWITSSNLSLAPLSAVAVTNRVLTYTLPSMSIVTFVGTATNVAPTLTPIPNQTVNAGVIVLATNKATDIYAPPQTLVHSLLNAPASAALDPSTGIFSWRPPVSSANTTSTVSVAVFNNGTPALGATNTFKIVVNPLAPATISSPTVSGQKINLLVNGTQGPDYTLKTTTNLLGTWQTVFTTNSPVLPWSFTYTNSANNPDLFFRIEMGP